MIIRWQNLKTWKIILMVIPRKNSFLVAWKYFNLWQFIFNSTMEIDSFLSVLHFLIPPIIKRWYKMRPTPKDTKIWKLAKIWIFSWIIIKMELLLAINHSQIINILEEIFLENNELDGSLFNAEIYHIRKIAYFLRKSSPFSKFLRHRKPLCLSTYHFSILNSI